jgi:hypothetical protein
MKRKLHRNDFYLISAISVIAIIVSTPFIIRLEAIMPVYLSSQAREQSLDAIFFLREQYGLTIGDMTLKEIKQQGDVTYITVSEDYHARRIDVEAHNDLHMDYVVMLKDGNFSVIEVRKRAS